MQLLLFLKFALSCNFQYTLSNHNPIYIEQFLQPGQTLCINTTIEYSIFILNSLDNSTIKTFDQSNIERALGYEELYTDAAAVAFGKMTGSLVITNSKLVNKTSISFISLSAISFPKDECEIKIISNQNKNFVFSSFDDSSVCYFNGNGINYRYQFHVHSGTIEIRPPHNISDSVFINHNSNLKSKFLNAKSITNNFILDFLRKRKNTVNSIKSNDSPESIFINHNLTKSEDYINNPSSYIRIDGYSPLILYKPEPISGTIDKSFFMELGVNYRQYPHKLDMRFVSNEPGIIHSNKNTDGKVSQKFFYGCDPYIFKYDSDGQMQIIDPNGRSVQSYYLELLSNTIFIILAFYAIQVAIMVYLFSFCCICPCCCCYKYCHRHSCCKRNQQSKYHSFNPRSEAINFLQSQNSINTVNYHNPNNDNNSPNNANIDENNDGFPNDAYNTDGNNIENSAYNISENQNQNANVVEEEEVEDDSINDAEDGLDLQDIDSHPVRDVKPQL